MSITSISSNGTQQLFQLLANSVQQASTSATGATTNDDSSGMSVSLSEPGRIFSKLSELAESDPEAFKWC